MAYSANRVFRPFVFRILAPELFLKPFEARRRENKKAPSHVPRAHAAEMEVVRLGRTVSVNLYARRFALLESIVPRNYCLE